MALIHLDHVPETVKVNLPLNIILPDPGRMGSVPVAKRKVLYLLHGLSDDASAWQRYSSIETLAAAYGLVVVMPSVGRSFYINQPNGQKYFTYLTEELPQYLLDVFGLVPNRENTFIAGNSMGGYGAFKAALIHPELYAAAASLSGVLSLAILTVIPNDPRRE
jgi:putative tributyrin esterase